MLTEEQELIVKTDYQKGQVVHISAFAGSGKTFTLQKLVERFATTHADWKILYLAFNKSVQMEASSKFPRNVTAKTIHALAYAKYGNLYRKKLVPDLRVNVLTEALGLKAKDFLLVKYVIDTLVNYFTSSNRFITEQHCPGMDDYAKKRFHRLEVIEHAKRVWKRMRDENDNAVGMLHDGYLKMFEIEEEQLPYDVILFDECQDANPVTTSIILKQEHALRVLVGDPHQQIYSFRGAVNAMQQVKTDFHYSLTGSFRFNQTIAEIANMLLMEYKGERKKIKGLGSKGCLDKIDRKNPYAVLTRTNAGIFDQATDLLSSSKLGFLGGIKNYKFSMIKDVYELYAGSPEKIRFSWFKKFKGLPDLQQYADDIQDVELVSLVKTVNKFKHEIPSLLSAIEKQTEPNLYKANVLLSTTHKAKGFEFKRVKLFDDFLDFYEEKNIRRAPELIAPDEINLYYVAVTRTKETLEINRRLKRNLAWLDKKYDVVSV